MSKYIGFSMSFSFLCWSSSPRKMWTFCKHQNQFWLCSQFLIASCNLRVYHHLWWSWRLIWYCIGSASIFGESEESANILVATFSKSDQTCIELVSIFFWHSCLTLKNYQAKAECQNTVSVLSHNLTLWAGTLRPAVLRVSWFRW